MCVFARHVASNMRVFQHVSQKLQIFTLMHNAATEKDFRLLLSEGKSPLASSVRCLGEMNTYRFVFPVRMWHG